MKDELILIVEDEDDIVELLRYNLEKANYQTALARNGEEAIDAVQCNMPAVVLLDIMMPELNGWEVCRILRESSKGRAVPIVMLTALSGEEARIKGLGLGADDFISKPFSIREVLLKIRKYVDRQEVIKQLQAREQEHETSLRYIVHEVRNSLTAIGGFSSLALRSDNGQRHLRTINTAAVHAQSLLNDFSLLTRLEKEGITLPSEPIDIVEAANDAVEILRDAAAKKNLELTVMKSTPSPVRADRTALMQVLVNLLSNAVKFNREAGRVWIYFDERQDRTEVTIKDEGCGIRRDELPRIFDKFYRAGGSEKIKGAGLGLYIVKLLVEAMGGNIMVVSDPGEGAQFTVSLIRENGQRSVAGIA